MVKRNIIFYERKNEIITKRWTLQGKISYYELLDEENVDIIDFWE